MRRHGTVNANGTTYARAPLVGGNAVDFFIPEIRVNIDDQPADKHISLYRLTLRFRQLSLSPNLTTVFIGGGDVACEGPNYAWIGSDTAMFSLCGPGYGSPRLGAPFFVPWGASGKGGNGKPFPSGPVLVNGLPADGKTPIPNLFGVNASIADFAFLAMERTRTGWITLDEGDDHFP